MEFAAFAGQKYLKLETFEKVGVRTSVRFPTEASAKLDSN